MSPAVNKHVLSGWCQQNCSVYEIIFSLNERLNELLSPVDPVPAPVFNISWAIFFSWVALSVLVTHCLELGNVYVSLEFAGRGKRRGDKAKFVCDCSARLHRCGWPITLKSPVEGGRGASVPLRARELLRCLVDSGKWRGRGFVFTLWLQNCVTGVTGSGLCSCDFLMRTWKQEMKGNAGCRRCLGLFRHVVCLCTGFLHLKIGSEAAFTIKQNKSAPSRNVVPSMQPYFP